jgi:hypothetical protein
MTETIQLREVYFSGPFAGQLKTPFKDFLSENMDRPWTPQSMIRAAAICFPEAQIIEIEAWSDPERCIVKLDVFPDRHAKAEFCEWFKEFNPEIVRVFRYERD